MTTLRVEIHNDGMIDLFGDAPHRTATLTDEHAACSYGMPVVVAADGTVLGAADVGGEIHPAERITTDDYHAHDLSESSVAADVSCGGTWTPQTYAGRRYQANAVDLLRRAQDAGYRTCCLTGMDS